MVSHTWCRRYGTILSGIEAEDQLRKEIVVVLAGNKFPRQHEIFVDRSGKVPKLRAILRR